MPMSQSRPLVRQKFTRHAFSSSSVTLRELWLRVDFWYCAMWNLKTSFQSTVLQLECERRAWQVGNWKMNYHLVKLIWKPGNVLIHPPITCGCVQYRNGCVTFQDFTDSHQHCWRRFGQSRCRFVFVCAFGTHRADCVTGESFKIFNLLSIARQ